MDCRLEDFSCRVANGKEVSSYKSDPTAGELLAVSGDPGSFHVKLSLGCWNRRRGIGDDKLHGGLVRKSDLDLFASDGDFEEIGQMFLRILCAYCHRSSVICEGGRVNELL